MLVQKKLGKVPLWLSKTILWVIDIIFPSIVSWQFAESGSGIGAVVDGLRTVPQIVFSILPLILAHCALYILHILYYPEVAYHPVRSVYWSGSSQMPFMLLGGWMVFLGAFCGEVHGIVMNVAYGLFILVTICGVVSVIILPKFISRFYNSVFNGLITASALTAVLQFIRIMEIDIDQDIVVLVAPILAIISIFIFQIIIRRQTEKYLLILDIIQDSEEEFDTFIKSPRRLIDIYRKCFATGHPYLLTWDLFVRGVELWPTNRSLLEQYLRLSAIYQTETVECIRVKEMIKQAYRDDEYMKTLRGIVKAISAARSRKTTSSLRHKLKEIRTQQNGVVSLQAAYWSALSEGATTAVYDLCRNIVSAQEELEASYMKLISEHPNNDALYMRFFLFLEKIECDQKEADIWKIRYETIRNSLVLEDLTHSLALKTFPAIPVFLPSHDPAVQPRSDKKSTVSISQVSMSISSSTDGPELSEEDEQGMIYAANLRESGLQMKLPFIDAILIVIGVFFVLICLASPDVNGSSS